MTQGFLNTGVNIVKWMGVTAVFCMLMTMTISVEASPAAGAKDRKYYEKRGEIVWEVPTKTQVIALTFDDGPDPVDTPEILKLLEQYNAKATFFIIGKHAERYPNIVRQEVEAGHELANHTFNHPFFNSRSSLEAIKAEMEYTEQVITQITGQKPTLFRPPGGYYSDRLIDAAKAFQYQVVLWSWHQDTEDWKRPGVHKIVNKVLSNAKNGDIILFHDFVGGRSQTAAALKQILPELQARGFRFVTVSELIGYDQVPHVNK